MFTYAIDQGCFVGIMPVRNYYMVYHMMRKAGQAKFDWKTSMRTPPPRPPPGVLRDFDGGIEADFPIGQGRRINVPFGYLYPRLQTPARGAPPPPHVHKRQGKTSARSSSTTMEQEDADDSSAMPDA